MIEEQKRHLNEGTLCLIEPWVIPVVKEFLTEFNPELVIELGTHKGGFTKYLAEWFPEATIYTTDVLALVSEEDLEELYSRNVIILTLDVFKEQPIIESLITSKVKKFLFCDDGDKPREVRTFAPLLSVGDLIGVHDWGSEIYEKDIAGVLDDYVPVAPKVTEADSQLRFFERVR